MFRTTGILIGLWFISGFATDALSQHRILSIDSTVSVVIPADFQPTLGDPFRDLRFMHNEGDVFVTLLWGTKNEEFWTDIKQLSEQAAHDMAYGLEDAQIGGSQPRTIGRLSALQYEIRGVLNGMSVVFQITVIEGKSTFAIALVGGDAEQWDEYHIVMGEIVESIELAPEQPEFSIDVFELVQGTWAWSDEEEPCRGLTQRFEFTASRDSMTIYHSELIELESGEMVSETPYVIEGSSPGVLHTYILGETRLTEDGVPVKWDLIMIARSRFVWRATNWPEGASSSMMLRCETNVSEATSESIFRYVDLGPLGRFELGEPFDHVVRLAIEESPFTYRLREGVFGGAESIIVTTDESGIVRLISFEYGTGYDWSEKLTTYVAFLGQPTHSSETEVVWDDGQTEFSLTRIADTPHAAGAVLRDIQATPR